MGERFLVIPPTLRRLVVPRSILAETRTLLAGPGRRGLEAAVLWLGPVISEEEATVDRAHFPRQIAHRSRHGLAIEIPVDEWTDLALRLPPGVFVLAKLHTHGEDAYHSDLDAANPYLSHEGAVSITVPHFAHAPLEDLTSCSVNVRRGHRWMVLTPAQARRAVSISQGGCIVPDDQVDGRLRWVQGLRPNAAALTIGEIKRRLDEAPVALVVGTELASNFAAQATALTSVNLLARLFRRLVLVVPDGVAADPRLPFVHGPLGRALAAFARRVCGDVAVELASAPPADAPALHIADAAPAGPATVYCSGAGWLARVSRRPVPLTVGEDANPVGPLVAAALGAAEVFKLVFGDVRPDILAAEDVALSALTYRVEGVDVGPPLGDVGPPLGEVTLPDTTLVGAGSIGSAILWGLAHLRGAGGSLAIVDHDQLATHNPDRAVLTLDGVAEREPPKATWARDVLEPLLPRLSVTPFRGTIREYVDTLPADYTLPLVISAVDSIESRRDIQDALPRHILNASTGPTKVEVSRHASLDGPCLYCLYLPELLSRSAVQIAYGVWSGPASNSGRWRS